MVVEPSGLARFEGPLDLLLALITRRELDITTISLAAVTEDYLAEVPRLLEEDLERLSGYLVIASRLLLIKSQALLPRRPPPEVEEDAEELIRQLEDYRRFKALATDLRQLQERGGRMYARQAPLSPPARSQPNALPAVELAAALARALARTPARPPAETLPTLGFPVAAKLAELDALLASADEVRLGAVLGRALCRQEIIAIFLALLELMRTGRAEARQQGLFGDVFVRRAEVTDHGGEEQAEGGADAVYGNVNGARVSARHEELVEFVRDGVQHGCQPGDEQYGGSPWAVAGHRPPE